MTSATITQIGSEYFVRSSDDIRFHTTLPVGVYAVKYNPTMGTYFLEALSGFDKPEKLYGNVRQRAERVLNTYKMREQHTGVLLSGMKGSGKSLLAKVIGDLAASDHNMPTLVISEAFHGEEFNQFIQQISQPCVVLFDEFEKVYPPDAQQKILTLFDGMYPSDKLYILTVNEHHSLDHNLINRPGRIYYSYEYDSLDSQSVEDYCNDKLNDKSQISTLVRFVEIYSVFNFDMLMAVVEEMNRYGESVEEVLCQLNVIPEVKSGETFRYVLSNTETGAEVEMGRNVGYQPSPFHYIVNEYYVNQIDEAAKKLAMLGESSEEPVHSTTANTRTSHHDVVFNDVNLVSINTKNGEFVYEKGHYRLTITRNSRGPYVSRANYLNLLQ